jgi:hypothetical protein
VGQRILDGSTPAAKIRATLEKLVMSPQRRRLGRKLKFLRRVPSIR